MPWQPIPSVTEPHYLDTNLNQVQKCVNWYHEKTPNGFVLKSLHGFSVRNTVANNSACRGAKFDATSGYLFSVHDNTVYRSDGFGSSALTGTLSTNAGQVVLASGLSQLVVTDGLYGYVIDPVAATVTKITDGNFPANAQSCACINGQFLVTTSDNDRWYMSKVDDGLTWTPLISGRAITSGDKLAHVEVVRDIAYFIGFFSTEPWSTSTVDPYLQPISGAAVPVGVRFPSHVARVGDRICLFGWSDKAAPSLYAIEGGQLNKIATPYIESRIQSWDYNAKLIAYSIDGCDFLEAYQIMSAGFTGFIYNFASGTWDEIPTSRGLAYVANAFITGSAPIGFSGSDGSLYYMGLFNTQNGSNLVRILDFKIDGGMSRTVNQGIRFELEAQHDSSSSYTLSATLQKSDDAGRTFDTGITISKAITNGTSAQQVILQTPPLGSFKAGRIYRLTFTGPAARLILRRAEGLVTVGRF